MFFGLAIKVIRKSRAAFLERQQLTHYIEAAEREFHRPLLQCYTGLKRFAIAQKTLDATLIAYFRTLRPSTRPRNLELMRYIRLRYLDRLREEFEMARTELSGLVADRAQVTALGLAIKEMALSLEHECQLRELTIKRLKRSLLITQALLVISMLAAFLALRAS